MVIIFDLDDTLFMEIDFLKSAFREIADRLSSSEPEELYVQMIGWHYSRENVFDNLARQFGVDKAELLVEYRNHYPAISLKSEVVDLLNSLQLNGYIIGLITDGRSVTQRNKIKALGLYKWIMEENIIISEEFGEQKPCDKNYQYFTDKYPNEEFFYVGDNVKKDFITPNRLGWKSICLLDDGNNIHKQDFNIDSKFLPTFIVNNLIDILKKINNRNI